MPVEDGRTSTPAGDEAASRGWTATRIARAVRRRLPRSSPSRSSPPGASTDFGVGRLHRVPLVRSDDPGYRINLVAPTVEGARVFGGIRTAVDLFEAVAATAPERRILAASGTGSATTDAVAGYVTGREGVGEPRQLRLLGMPGATLAVRPNDVFIATFWTTAELVMRVRRWQAEAFGRAPRHFGYVIQDYEPGFYPFSVESELARATYGDPSATAAVFNTSVLRDWFHGLDIEFAAEHVFEPRMLLHLRAALAGPAVRRKRVILVYGRPKTARNAFPAIVDGLRAWRVADAAAGGWTVVSIGQEHPDVDLGGGMVMRSAGKLSLDAYATLLLESAVGISLMVSPHPSYPPLEMAHMGMLVVANRFGTKDLAAWHTNVTTVGDLSADSMAVAIATACGRFDLDPGAGARGVSRYPLFMSDEPQFPFAADLAAQLEVGTRA